MVGADLKNLVNETALRAARHGEDRVTMADFSAGKDRPRDRDVPRGAGADRLPRIRPRPARHAHPRRQPGPQDRDRPPDGRPLGHLPAIGPVSLLPSAGQESPADGVAPAARDLVDTGTRRIIEECFEQALQSLRYKRDRLNWLARTFLDRETLDEDEACAAAGIRPGAAPAAIAHGEAAGVAVSAG